MSKKVDCLKHHAGAFGSVLLKDGEIAWDRTYDGQEQFNL